MRKTTTAMPFFSAKAKIEAAKAAEERRLREELAVAAAASVAAKAKEARRRRREEEEKAAAAAEKAKEARLAEEKRQAKSETDLPSNSVDDDGSGEVLKARTTGALPAEQSRRESECTGTCASLCS